MARVERALHRHRLYLAQNNMRPGKRSVSFMNKTAQAYFATAAFGLVRCRRFYAFNTVMEISEKFRDAVVSVKYPYISC